jgi:geranylgeranyl pyrophosphate synthase
MISPAGSPDPAAYFDTLRPIIDAGLAHALPAGTAPPLIVEAMRYAVSGGGKRLRPILALAVADAVGERLDLDRTRACLLALPGACAVELVHTYSLVHDDLPAMDDDALRRGRATSHVVYGDGLAILSGDGLLTEAFGLLGRSPSPVLPPGAPEVSVAGRLQQVAVLASAAGAAGMVGGQTIDLAAAGRILGHRLPPLDAAALDDMHARKTGALIRAAAAMGAIATDADVTSRAAVDEYASELGLAFQILDDVLDVEGSADALGKTAGKDAVAGKPTYPLLFGVGESRRRAAACIERAKAALAAAGLGGRLADIADWSLTRQR